MAIGDKQVAKLEKNPAFQQVKGNESELNDGQVLMAQAVTKQNIFLTRVGDRRFSVLANVFKLEARAVLTALVLSLGSMSAYAVPSGAGEWLSSASQQGYTIQLATIYGAQECSAFAQRQQQVTHCFESSTVENRWFAVTGDYENRVAAQTAAKEFGIVQPWVNSIARIRRNQSQFIVADGLRASAIDIDELSLQSSSEGPLAKRTLELTQADLQGLPNLGNAVSAGFDLSNIHLAANGAGSGNTDGGSFHGKHEPKLSSTPKPFLTEKELGSRTPPLIEWGGDFLGTGNIRRGYILPTGAVWTPQLWVYGTGRSAFQGFERAGASSSSSEWVNRLDLFGNLQLSGTERVLIGISPLHREDLGDNRFSGNIFSPDENEGSVNRLNARVRTLFFEGDLSEIFPKWDAKDGKRNDIGFSVGRQGVLFQDGMTINDTLDSIGLSKNNIRFEGVPWLVNWRSSVLYAWDEVNRGNNEPDEDAELYAWFNQWDTIKSTIDLDLIYVDSEDESDQFVASINFIQRLGKIGSLFRVAHSSAMGDESSVAADGTLLFAELNYVPAYTHDNMYLNMFASYDNYTSAARDPLGGGPLGRVGLLYAASGLGSYPAPLSNDTNDAYGFSAGYQKIDEKNRRQFTLEVGARDSDLGNAQYGIAARFQQALGKRFVLQVDGFVADQEDFDSSYGARLELLFKL